MKTGAREFFVVRVHRTLRGKDRYRQTRFAGPFGTRQEADRWAMAFYQIVAFPELLRIFIIQPFVRRKSKFRDRGR